MLDHGIEHFAIRHVGAVEAEFVRERLFGAEALAGR